MDTAQVLGEKSEKQPNGEDESMPRNTTMDKKSARE